MKLKNCRSCGSQKFNQILDLGKQPWCGDLLSKKQLGSEKIYPLNLIQCKKCELLQLDFTVPKEIMFSNHTYLSSTTKTLKQFFYKLALENKKHFKLKKSDLILDIGGNDGTQMMQYQKAGLKNVLNVESAKNIAKISKRNGVKTIHDFFNYDVAKNKIGKNKVKLINASGVFFHLEELHSVLRAIKYCLRKEDGILVIQFMYVGSIVDKCTFDSIYHEHLCLYSIKSLSYLLNLYDFDILDAYYADIHSGSIIVKACNKYSKINIKTNRLRKALANDKKYNKQSIRNFSKRAKIHAENIKTFLHKIKKENPELKIYCYGAPAKGNTLLNYLNLDNKIINKSVEVNKLKIGKFLAMSHIPIAEEKKTDLPDYYLLLSHNFEKEIISKNQKILEKGVKFIIPFPKLKVVSKISKKFKNQIKNV